MIATITRVWPKARRVMIIGGFINAPVAVFVWLLGGDPSLSGFLVFVALVAFLLGAKANDDPS